METISVSTFDKFFSITGINLIQYFSLFSSFADNKYSNVVDYYKGDTDTPDRSSFKELETLIELRDIINQKITTNVDSFQTYDFWILIEKLEEISQSLDTMGNTSKWLRSSILPSSWSKSPLVQKTVDQGETLESFAKNKLQNNDSQNDWSEIALSNELREEDYTPDGGIVVKVSGENSVLIFIQSVVDNLNLDNIYGRDFDRKLTFVDNDLKILEPKDTIYQAAVILGNLKKGDNPAFPEHGIDKSFVAGRNMASIAFPSLLRQLQETFANDDTFSSITVQDIKQEQDLISITYQIRTVLFDILPELTTKI